MQKSSLRGFYILGLFVASLSASQQAHSSTVAPVTAYSGIITLTANARQEGSPKLSVSLDGVSLGTVAVAANSGAGQSGTYSFKFISKTEPQKVDITLDGYTATEQKSVALDVFDVYYTENTNGKVDLNKLATPKVISGQASVSPPAFYTNGSTLEFQTPAAIAAAAVVHVPVQQVAAGCPVPSSVPTGNVWYVDPVHGSMTGDGSKAHPWHTLAEVFAANLFANHPLLPHQVHGPDEPIKSGDTIYLMSGNHGAIKVQGQFTTLAGYNNTDFITIAAAPGQTPVISELDFIGAEKWVFRGITFANVNTTGKAPGPEIPSSSSGNDIYLVTMRDVHDNIILDHDTFMTQGASTAWNMSDWAYKRVSGIEDNQGSCISVTNNQLTNIGFGIDTQRSTGVVLAGNTIDHFTDDGIDYGSSNLLIENNKITNSIEDGDGYHRDGMQGQPYTEATVVQNVVIQKNTIIRETDPTIKTPGLLQGIDTFDGIWQNVTVANNVVITYANQGISYYGVTGLNVTGNILLSDNGRVVNCVGVPFATCAVTPVTMNPGSNLPIVVQNSKAGVPSSNIVISGNVTSSITPNAATQNATISNNMLLTPEGGKNSILSLIIGGKLEWYGKAGTYPTNNVITGKTPDQIFTAFDTTNLNYNFAFKPGYAMP